MNFIKFIRIFLLVLIFIGIGLLVTQKRWVPKVVEMILKNENKEQPISQISDNKISNPNLSTVGVVAGLPVDIQSNAVFMNWYKSKQKKFNDINTFSHYLIMGKIGIDKQKPYDGSEICNGAGAITNPNGNKIACVGAGLGASDLMIYDKTKKISGVLQYCATCSEENGFWLDNDKFVFLSNYKDDQFKIYKEFIVVQEFDFIKNRSDSWSAGVKND